MSRQFDVRITQEFDFLSTITLTDEDIEMFGIADADENLDELKELAVEAAFDELQNYPPMPSYEVIEVTEV